MPVLREGGLAAVGLMSANKCKHNQLPSRSQKTTRELERQQHPINRRIEFHAMWRLGPLRPKTFRPPRGQKQVFLYLPSPLPSHLTTQPNAQPANPPPSLPHSPSFTITLLRTPNLPATMASFLVPLNLNKLDLKDYLYHAYDLPVLSVRSYIQQQKIRQDKPAKLMPAPRRWFRPRAIKKMTVELERAFVWPKEPDEFDA